MRAACIKKALCLSVLFISIAISLQGCPLVLFGAASGGILVAADRRTLGAQTEDREIQIKAATQLAHDLPHETNVHVTVFNRHVLLTGEVPQLAIKQRAEAIVGAITNVQSERIVNELAIQGASSLMGRSNDAYITTKVKASLVHAQDLSANFFKVVTERGIVYLMGLVTVDESRRAADIASRVPGVLQVVKVFQYIQPQELKGR